MTQHVEVVNDAMILPMKKFAKVIPNETKEAMKTRENAASKFHSAKVSSISTRI